MAWRTVGVGRALEGGRSWLPSRHPLPTDLSPQPRARVRGEHYALGDGSELGAGLLTPPAERPQVSRPGSCRRPVDDGATAYVVRCACAPSPDGKKGATVVDHVRLFPIRPGVRWAYRAHEQILPSLKRANIAVRWTDGLRRIVSNNHPSCVKTLQSPGYVVSLICTD